MVIKNLDLSGEMGIHTVQVKFTTKQDIEVIRRLEIVHDDKVLEYEENQCTVVLDFSKGRLNFEHTESSLVRDDMIETEYGYCRVFCDPTAADKELSTISEAMEGVDTFAKLFALGETVACTRVDIAYDLKVVLDDNLKLFMYFIEMFNIAIKGKGMYRTEKKLFESGNLKCSSSKKGMTAYDERDKENRAGYLRLEYRETDIRNSYDIKTVLENTFKGYSTSLQGVINNYKIYKEKVQKNHVNLIGKFREKQMKKKNYIDFKSYVNGLEMFNKVLTRDILKELHQRSECSKSFKKWLEDYRNTDVLIDDETGEMGKAEINFVSDKSVIDLFKSIRKKAITTLNKG